jgi:flavin-dependent dehydrogenase
MDLPDDCDVAIVGAGPAGLACALTLKGKGLTIKIFDKKAFPRSKPCGGGLGIRAIHTLQKLSPYNHNLLDNFEGKPLLMDLKLQLQNIKIIHFH